MRAVLISMLALAACGHAPRIAPEPPPARFVPPIGDSFPDPYPDQITICVYSDGKLREVPMKYVVETGDSLIGERRFSQVHPTTTPPYAAGAEWFVRKEPIVVGSGEHARKSPYGLGRVLGISEIEQVGEWRGVPVFAEAGATGTPDAVYLLVRPGCEFQPYRTESVVSAVRG